MTPRIVSVGKYRALQRATTTQGHFAILALDHQDALRRALRSQDPRSVTSEDLIAFKTQVVAALAPEASGVLLDPVYGAAQAVRSGTLGSRGLLVELEKADYQLEPMPLACEVLPGWSVAKIKRMGADGVKLFYYYDPEDEGLAASQDRLLRQIADACVLFDIPFYAEPILTPPVHDGDAAASFTERIVRAAGRAAALGADVLKLEFPVPPSLQDNDRACQSACARLTEILDVPWVLLSAGVSFEAFCRQLEIACAAGASGYIVGRAVWGEVAAIKDAGERQRWLETTGVERLRRLGGIAASGRRWTATVDCEPVTTSWYRTYPEVE